MIAPTPATELRRASLTDDELRSWLIRSRMPTGTITHVATFRIRSVPARSSLCTTVNCLASLASRAA